MFFLSSADFFQNQLFEKIISGTPSVSNNLDPDQARRSVGPDQFPNCLEKLSADITKRQRVQLKTFMHSNLQAFS